MKGILAIVSSVLLLLATWLAPGSAGAMVCGRSPACPCCASACACAPVDADAAPDLPVPAPVPGRGLAGDLLVAVIPARLVEVPAASPAPVPAPAFSLSFPEAEPLFQRICVRLL